MYPHDFLTPTLVHESEWADIFDMMNMGWPQHHRRLAIQQIEHPRHGILTAVRSGKYWMVFAGEYIDAGDDTKPPRLYPSTKLVNMVHAREFGVDPYL